MLKQNIKLLKHFLFAQFSIKTSSRTKGLFIPLRFLLIDVYIPRHRNIILHTYTNIFNKFIYILMYIFITLVCTKLLQEIAKREARFFSFMILHHHHDHQRHHHHHLHHHHFP